MKNTTTDKIKITDALYAKLDYSNKDCRILLGV